MEMRVDVATHSAIRPESLFSLAASATLITAVGKVMQRTLASFTTGATGRGSMMSRVVTGTMTSFIRDVKRIFGFVKWSVKRPSVSFIPTIIMETGMHTFARVVTMLRAYSGSLMRAKSMMMETTAEIVRTLMKAC